MNWFIDPITKQYADFEGRTGRQAFWMYVLIYWVVLIVASVVNETAALLLSLALFIPNLAITARRLHDVGKSGWWMLITFVPIIGIIVLIVFNATKGDEGSNRFGNSAQPSTGSDDLPHIPPLNQSNLEVPKPPVDNA